MLLCTATHQTLHRAAARSSSVASRNISTRMASSSSSSHLQPSPEQTDRVTKQIEEVRGRITKATEQSKRDREVSYDTITYLQWPALRSMTDFAFVVIGIVQPRLVAISKLHPPTSILAAHTQAKQVHFGENYAQELEAKSKVLPRSIKWHFVGKLQSNKAKLIAGERRVQDQI